jgi:pilus assembly protein CpaE
MIRTLNGLEDEPQPNRWQPRVIAVVGTRGGVGCTSLAVNLGCTLAQTRSLPVTLLDLDLSLGDADVALDLIPSTTLSDLGLKLPQLDTQMLDAALCRHVTGLAVLPCPTDFDLRRFVTADLIRHLVFLFRSARSNVIFDTSKQFNDVDYAAIELADVIFLVIRLDLTSIRNAVRVLLEFESSELKHRVKVIAMDDGEESDVDLVKAAEVLGLPIFWQLPFDRKTMSEARGRGVPLVTHAPESQLHESIVGLMNALWK